MNFLIRPEPYVCESTLGYLHRFSSENGFMDLGDFGNALSTIIDADDLRCLSLTDLGVITGLSTALLYERLPIVYDPEIKTHSYGTSICGEFAFNFLNPRICPACLQREAVCHFTWDLSLVTACEIHAVELVDICPNCSSPLGWDRPELETCTCGMRLADWPTGTVCPDVIEFQQIFLGRVLGLLDAAPWLAQEELFGEGQLDVNRLSKAVLSLIYAVLNGAVLTVYQSTSRPPALDVKNTRDGVASLMILFRRQHSFFLDLLRYAAGERGRVLDSPALIRVAKAKSAASGSLRTLKIEQEPQESDRIAERRGYGYSLW